MGMKFKYIVFLLFVFQTTFGQTKADFKDNEISTNSELDFLKTDKRGIKSNDEIIYYVEKDLQTLTAYENGKVKWKTNIIGTCGEPSVGKSEIRFIRLNNGTINLIFGKHNFANVNITDGKINDSGSD
ncbi:hypothetical protein ACG2LH_00890 [Zhouia sp. PK063]|uniref:hypothetical protein n=1 Tax=Zhouia sp. PK063 TaxID=3373602 RepID=UPI003792C95B